MLCPVELHPNPGTLLSFNGNHAYWFNDTTASICLGILFSEHAFVSRADVLGIYAVFAGFDAETSLAVAIEHQ